MNASVIIITISPIKTNNLKEKVKQRGKSTSVINFNCGALPSIQLSRIANLQKLKQCKNRDSEFGALLIQSIF